MCGFIYTVCDDVDLALLVHHVWRCAIQLRTVDGFTVQRSQASVALNATRTSASDS